MVIISQDLDEIFLLADRIAVIAARAALGAGSGARGDAGADRPADGRGVRPWIGHFARGNDNRTRGGSACLASSRAAISRFSGAGGSPVLALILTAVISGGIFAFMGRPPILTVYTFLISPLFAPDGLASLAVKAAPLIMMGVGLSLAYRANIWNIFGTEGQFTVGAITAGGVALGAARYPRLGAVSRPDDRRSGGWGRSMP